MANSAIIIIMFMNAVAELMWLPMFKLLHVI